SDAVVVESWVGPDVRLNVTPVLGQLAAVLGNVTGRGAGVVSVVERDGPPVPEGGWTREALAAQAQPYLRQRTVTLRVLWVGSMAWAANATYDGFGAADRADWAAARGPGGVCV